MNRMRHAFAAALVAAVSVGGYTLFAQDPPKAPEFKSVLAGKKFIPPIRGQADVDFIRTPARREGTTLVTRIQVKNTSAAPIPRLTIDETWYDKANNVIGGGKGVINGLLQPGEVQTIEIRTPVDPKMSSSKWLFSHANGAVKQHEVRSFDAPAQAAAKAPAKKK